MNGVILFLTLESIALPFEDLRRFPSHDIACQNYCFADQCVQHLEKELCIEADFSLSPLILHSIERRHLTDTLQESKRFRACWKALVFCRKGDNRMENMDRLRRLLGESDFAAGQMPPAAPWWRFRHSD